jgi:uncharacterized protein (TIGR03382 family)
LDLEISDADLPEVLVWDDPQPTNEVITEVVEVDGNADAINQSESTANGTTSVPVAAAAGGVSGAFAVGAAAVGLLMHRRRQRTTLKFQEIAGSGGILNNNPLFTEQQFTENPLFESASGTATVPDSPV